MADIRQIIDESPGGDTFAKLRTTTTRGTSAGTLRVVFVTVPVETPATKRPYPDRMYVPVPAITKAISAFVFIFSALSLFISLVTGFTVIHRLFSALFLLFSAGFYAMGRMLEKSSKGK